MSDRFGSRRERRSGRFHSCRGWIGDRAFEREETCGEDADLFAEGAQFSLDGGEILYGAAGAHEGDDWKDKNECYED